MRVAIVGSRHIKRVNIEEYIPEGVSEIISGGAKGVDALAADYADCHNITLTEILPDYKRYGRKAPIIRNKEIVMAADFVLVFWDGSSRGSASVIELVKRFCKPHKLVLVGRDEPNRR